MSFGRDRRLTGFDPLAARASTPSLRPLHSLQAAETSPRSPRPLRLPSNIKRAAQLRQEIREGRESGAFSYRNGFFRLVGTTRQGTPTGYGVVYLSDGGLVEGEFNQQGELTCSQGCRRWPDGTTYAGPLHDGEAHGEGTLVSVNGDEYHGTFACGLRNGEGTLCNRLTGLEYRGEFVNHLFHGCGELTTPTMRCQGEFVRGKPEGLCTMRWANGDTYRGHALAGKPDTSATRTVTYVAAETPPVQPLQKSTVITPPGSKPSSRGGGTPALAPQAVTTPPPPLEIVDESNSEFFSKATGITFCGTFRQGKRSTPCNAACVTEVFVSGSQYLNATQAKQTLQLRALGSKPPVGASSKSLTRSAIVKQAAADASKLDLPRYVDQLTKSADKFVSVVLGKPVAVEVSLCRKVIPVVTAATTAKKTITSPMSKAAVPPPPTTVDLDLTETGRIVCLSAYRYPDHVAVDALPSHFANLAAPPTPVPLLNKPVERATPDTQVTPMTRSMSRSILKASQNRTPMHSPGLAASGCTSPASLLGAEYEGVPMLRGRTTLGRVTFDINLAEPGSYALHFYVPAGDASLVQTTPGDDLSITTLHRVQGFMPIRVVRQC